MTTPFRAAVLTVSDRCSRGEAIDTAGPGLCEILRERLRAEVVQTRTVPDEGDQISRCFIEWSEPERGIDLIVSTGGTGLSPRDHTPEAARAVFHREHSALMELARLRCLPKTPRTFLSRGIAGTRNNTLILTLPGSPRGAADHLEALVDVLPHAIEALRGEAGDHGVIG